MTSSHPVSVLVSYPLQPCPGRRMIWPWLLQDPVPPVGPVYCPLVQPRESIPLPQLASTFLRVMVEVLCPQRALVEIALSVSFGGLSCHGAQIGHGGVACHWGGSPGDIGTCLLSLQYIGSCDRPRIRGSASRRPCGCRAFWCHGVVPWN